MTSLAPHVRTLAHYSALSDTMYYKQAEAHLPYADKRKQFKEYTVLIEDDPDKAADMEAYAVADGRRLTVVLPRTLACVPLDVCAETAIRAMRRLWEPSLSMYGPMAAELFGTDWFRNMRINALGNIGMAPYLSGFLRRTGIRPTRIESEFYRTMDSPNLVFLGALMRVRSIGIIPLSDEVPEPRMDLYADPYLHAVFYDRKRMNSLEKQTECMTLMFRACAFITCYDLRANRLDEKRFMLMLSMCPFHDEGVRMAREGGLRFPTYRCERRLLLA